MFDMTSFKKFDYLLQKPPTSAEEDIFIDISY